MLVYLLVFELFNTLLNNPVGHFRRVSVLFGILSALHKGGSIGIAGEEVIAFPWNAILKFWPKYGHFVFLLNKWISCKKNFTFLEKLHHRRQFWLNNIRILHVC